MQPSCPLLIIDSTKIRQALNMADGLTEEDTQAKLNEISVGFMEKVNNSLGQQV